MASTTDSHDMVDIIPMILELVMDGLFDNELFPAIDISACDQCSTLQQMQEFSNIVQLQHIFTDAGLPARLGFNAGTGEVSLTMPLPCGDEALNRLQLAIERGCRRTAVLWAMLALYPMQLPLEELYRCVFAPSSSSSSSSPTSSTSSSSGDSSHHDDDDASVCMPHHHRPHLGAASSKSQHISTPASARVDESSNHLANRCLLAFREQTRVAITSRRMDFRQQNLRITLIPANSRNPFISFFVFNPSYTSVLGFDPNTATWQESINEQQRTQLVQDMLRTFWQRMRSAPRRYLVDQSLRDDLSLSLVRLFTAALPLHLVASASFQPPPPPRSQPLNLYLHGSQGIGKSSFVKSFRHSLEHVVRRYIEPNKKAMVVKLPLNAMSPSHLHSVLHVKGISDMSIERLIEQTLCKGDLVIFHLEENPEEPELQNQLFERTQLMLNKLCERYPEYRANISCIYTSNYPPSEMIAKAARVLTVTPPSNTDQRWWCAAHLKDIVNAHLPHILRSTATDEIADASTSTSTSNRPIQAMPQVRVAFGDSLPPPTTDLRPLERWWMSLGFHIVAHLREHLPAYASLPLSNILIRITGSLNDLRVLTTLTSISESLLANLVASSTTTSPARSPMPSPALSSSTGSPLVTPSSSSDSMTPWITFDAALPSPTAATPVPTRPATGDAVASLLLCTSSNGTLPITIEDVKAAVRSHSPCPDGETPIDLPELQLAAPDVFFCHRLEHELHGITHSTLADQTLLDARYHATLVTIVDMLASTYLRPSVIVFHGGDEQKRAAQAKVLFEFVSSVCGERLRHTDVVLRTEDDKRKVFGQPGEILGGLFRFIDRVNNLNACDGRIDLVGVITATVNSLGQFIIRDLLEPEPSRTHRQTAHKDRIMFIITVDDHCAITPQLHSRTHCMIDCS